MFEKSSTNGALKSCFSVVHELWNIDRFIPIHLDNVLKKKATNRLTAQSLFVHQNNRNWKIKSRIKYLYSTLS